ncbi:hypothetical protein QBC45DRAFT_133723 [Copromyces sp. CBS 386.78]|nr:hypothetical protein QBC45DRAFT_133723 [Copromyces sp. CBS 386.78]
MTVGSVVYERSVSKRRLQGFAQLISYFGLLSSFSLINSSVHSILSPSHSTTTLPHLAASQPNYGTCNNFRNCHRCMPACRVGSKGRRQGHREGSRGHIQARQNIVQLLLLQPLLLLLLLGQTMIIIINSKQSLKRSLFLTTSGIYLSIHLSIYLETLFSSLTQDEKINHDKPRSQSLLKIDFDQSQTVTFPSTKIVTFPRSH